MNFKLNEARLKQGVSLILRHYVVSLYHIIRWRCN